MTSLSDHPPAGPATARLFPGAFARPRALYDGEPDACRREARPFLQNWAGLALILAVALVYEVDSREFRIALIAALAALPAHYLLPIRWKRPFLVAASTAALVATYGIAASTAVVAVGLALVGIAFLPIRWSLRAGLLAASAVGLGVARAYADSMPIPAAAWPLIGSFFLFRMALFLYELKHDERPERPIDALSYFFLLPNTCFLHFPVVDYRNFRRGHFAEEIHANQRRGLGMMALGVVHLLLYRIVRDDLLIEPTEVDGPASLAGYLACNYLLYLRVAGQFHAACGMLHLFGFRLPETHRNFLLATGFTDYWRRINIYWKDFMVRLVFHPIALRLRKRPQGQALAVATVAVFVTTWALHALQSFWIRGEWGFSVTDALFWGILGGLVLVNVRNDAKRRPSPKRDRGIVASLMAHGVRSAKIAGTLATILILWALWSSPDVGEFTALIRRGLP